jgi:RNA polymerase sigma factor (sigma-70 family)
MSDHRRRVDTSRGVDRSLEQLAQDAAAGDAAALEIVLRELRDPMYALALRFLGNRHDAEDATQEILVRIATRLSTFEGRSKLTTWAHTVATRMLLRAAPSRTESSVRGADDFVAFLDANLATVDFPADEVEYNELCEEVRISCTYGMLLCLSRRMRAAYLLGDVLGLTDVEAAEICECSPAAFRQRLARSRSTLRRIIDGRCGVVDPANPCSCGRQIQGSLAAGIMQRNRLDFLAHRLTGGPAPAIDPSRFERAADQIETIVEIGNLYRRDRFATPASVWERVQDAMPDVLSSP